jgi:hypothetical protein
VENPQDNARLKRWMNILSLVNGDNAVLHRLRNFLKFINLGCPEESHFVYRVYRVLYANKTQIKKHW